MFYLYERLSRGCQKGKFQNLDSGTLLLEKNRLLSHSVSALKETKACVAIEHDVKLISISTLYGKREEKASFNPFLSACNSVQRSREPLYRSIHMSFILFTSLQSVLPKICDQSNCFFVVSMCLLCSWIFGTLYSAKSKEEEAV